VCQVANILSKFCAYFRHFERAPIIRHSDKAGCSSTLPNPISAAKRLSCGSGADNRRVPSRNQNVYLYDSIALGPLSISTQLKRQHIAEFFTEQCEQSEQQPSMPEMNWSITRKPTTDTEVVK